MQHYTFKKTGLCRTATGEGCIDLQNELQKLVEYEYIDLAKNESPKKIICKKIPKIYSVLKTNKTCFRTLITRPEIQQVNSNQDEHIIKQIT